MPWVTRKDHIGEYWARARGLTEASCHLGLDADTLA